MNWKSNTNGESKWRGAAAMVPLHYADARNGNPAIEGGGVSSSADPSRRAFVQAGLFALVLGALPAAHTLARGDVLRPPGGQDEKSFISSCIRCDRCRSICPTGAIGVANFETGILNVRTPLMKFHIGYCTMCKKCVEVCPTQALKPFRVDTVKIGIAIVTDRCIAWSVGGCNICRGACPYGAITLDKESRPVVDPHKCNGCGVCEKVCPALMLRSYLGGEERGIEVKPISPTDTL